MNISTSNDNTATVYAKSVTGAYIVQIARCSKDGVKEPVQTFPQSLAPETTVYRGTLRAIVDALERLDGFDGVLTVYVDLRSLAKGYSGCKSLWEQTGRWAKATGKPFEHADVWQKILSLRAGRPMEVLYAWDKRLFRALGEEARAWASGGAHANAA